MAARVKVLHAISLDTPGGTERSFCQHIANDRTGRCEHHLLIARAACHPSFRGHVRKHAASVHCAKLWHGLKIPQHPPFLRRGHLHGIFRSVRPDVTILYNCLGNVPLAEAAAADGGPCVYWERGAAWMSHAQENVTRFLSRMDAVLCNSRAGKRMLELRWGADGTKILVRHNPLRTDFAARAAAPRRAPPSDSLRIGIAGRMVAFKGFPLALHAVQRLRGRGIRCELDLAGDGPDAPALRNLAEQLGIQDRVRFRGHEPDLAGFYQEMDILLCPSIREPFGNVCAEAGQFGLPVIATLVDGIPETVLHEETGLCLPPTLPLGQYAGFGGTLDALPQWTYDPRTDRLARTMILNPDDIATATASLMGTGNLDQMSRAARQRAATDRRFDDYVEWFNNVVARLMA